MTDHATFWNKIADRYAARPVDFPDAYAATLDRVRHHLRDSDTVLELGAGTGSTAIALAPHVASYTATDISARMLEIARGKPEAAALSTLSFLQADGHSAPEGPFDAVLAFNLLHLVPDLPATLAEIHHRLPTGGLLIAKTPCLANLGLWLRVLIPVLRLFGRVPPVRFLSRDATAREIEAAGFEILERADYPASRAAHFIVARAR
ncbi:MAG: class I SAM-dependent methyltransferase [Pseudomonadota bacterium]